jgi:hypothetical protein
MFFAALIFVFKCFSIAVTEDDQRSGYAAHKRLELFKRKSLPAAQ